MWLAGRGATPRVLEEIAVNHLGADLVADVAELTGTARVRRSDRGEHGNVAVAGADASVAGAGGTDTASEPPTG